MRRRAIRVVGLVLVFASVACGTTRISARATVTPLMLGQVRYIGPNVGRLPQSDVVTTFVASASSTQGGIGDLHFQGLNGSVPHALDLAIADMPQQDRSGVLAVSPIACELRHYFAIFVSIVHSDCTLQTARLTTFPEPMGPKPLR